MFFRKIKPPNKGGRDEGEEKTTNLLGVSRRRLPNQKLIYPIKILFLRKKVG